MTIRLSVGSEDFMLSPHSTKTKKIGSGELFYTASAPGVLPLSGKHEFEPNNKYTWTFSIITKHR